jgi:hypothetical protein
MLYQTDAKLRQWLGFRLKVCAAVRTYLHGDAQRAREHARHEELQRRGSLRRRPPQHHHHHLSAGAASHGRGGGYLQRAAARGAMRTTGKGSNPLPPPQAGASVGSPAPKTRNATKLASALGVVPNPSRDSGLVHARLGAKFS